MQRRWGPYREVEKQHVHFGQVFHSWNGSSGSWSFTSTSKLYLREGIRFLSERPQTEEPGGPFLLLNLMINSSTCCSSAYASRELLRHVLVTEKIFIIQVKYPHTPSKKKKVLSPIFVWCVETEGGINTSQEAVALPAALDPKQL